tara:strand:+ start:1102 stop:1863 length:762 start_codon:yes stop_codon:yes gene_type:complete
MVQKVCLVTGAARGIGLATVRLFVENNFSVIMVDRDAEELNKVSSSIKHSHVIVCDVSKENNVVDLFEEIKKKIGRLDVLVNNAGVAEFGPIDTVNFEGWKRVLSTNLDGVFLCSQLATPLLKISKGAIVNIASISGLRASTLRVAYGTSKAAVIHLTKQQAVELGEFGIRSNCVAPGPVRTKLAMAVHTKEIIEAYHDAIPMNRYGTEQEIAEAIFFLASEKAKFITGQLVSADGGFEATGVGLPALRDNQA